MRQSDTGSRYIVQALPYVLPEGVSLLPVDLGVDDSSLRKTTSSAIYLQIVHKEDREFRIRLENPAGTTNFSPGGDGESTDVLPELSHLSLEAQEGGSEWRIVDDVEDEGDMVD